MSTPPIGYRFFLLLIALLSTDSYAQRSCGDFDSDADVDAADRSIQTMNWTGVLRSNDPAANKFYEDGDCDEDRDVDTADQVALLQNSSGIKQFAGNLTNGDDADLVYDPTTGEVIIDASDTSFGQIIGFVVATTEDNLRNANFVNSIPGNAGPFIDVGTNTDNTGFQIGQTDALNQGAGPLVELGAIFPTGMTSVNELADYLSLAEYASFTGTGGTLDLLLVERLLGDVNGDGDVDAADRTTLIENWTGALLGSGPKLFTEGDFDFDGDVDSADMTLLTQNWTGAMAANIVPEPSGRTLIGIVLLLLSTSCRRRHSCENSLLTS